ncbi:nitroreductase family protein [Salinisphaera orenii]|uniref:Nitroreductase n=1 Tax=Salinisphaera orenii YIM 95161 TaxID=1051139 RepID=A0A423QAQ1_9GAMM|nr:nitroreductase [Salinisphaera halophila]ROO37613.1 nitroreductase [Salinisphaera halophila YIM 95161]
MVDRAALEASPIEPADAARFLRGRRSVDQFRDTVPDPALVREAIEIARWAPNHHETQPWRFYLIGPRTQADIVELNAALVAERKGDDVAATKRERWRRVPGWLAVTCVRDDDPVTAQEDYGACACAIHNLSLYLHSAGVESKWTSGTVTRETRFLEMLGADPAREYCVGLIWYGYPKRRPRTQRRDLGEIVFSCP